MHTIVVTSGGILLLGFVRLAGNWLNIGALAATLVFIATWFAISLINLWIGVSHAGYSVEEEAPILGVVFGIPAVLALAIWWFRRS